jgi:hypothetical protein
LTNIALTRGNLVRSDETSNQEPQHENGVLASVHQGERKQHMVFCPLKVIDSIAIPTELVLLGIEVFDGLVGDHRVIPAISVLAT